MALLSRNQLSWERLRYVKMWLKCSTRGRRAHAPPYASREGTGMRAVRPRFAPCARLDVQPSARASQRQHASTRPATPRETRSRISHS
eukprot:6206028-Pleurochrysis_carterae.AAC.1